MSEKFESLRGELSRIEEWGKKVAQNAPISPQEFMRESQAVKDQALKVYESLVCRSKETGEPEDPFMAAIEKVIMSNEPVVRDRILKLVYAGELDPIAYYEIVADILKKHSSVAQGLQDLRKGALSEAMTKGCLICALCGACLACITCFVTGLVASGASGLSGASGAESV